MPPRRLSPYKAFAKRPPPPRGVVRGEPGKDFRDVGVERETMAMLFRELTRRCARVESRAKILVSGEMVNVDTGRLRSSIRHTIGISRTAAGFAVVGRVGTNVKYARYLHDGTGIYGPRRMRIFPTTAQFLRWESGGAVIYRRSVAGIKPRPFLRRALRDTAGGAHP